MNRDRRRVQHANDVSVLLRRSGQVPNPRALGGCTAIPSRRSAGGTHGTKAPSSAMDGPSLARATVSTRRCARGLRAGRVRPRARHDFSRHFYPARISRATPRRPPALRPCVTCLQHPSTTDRLSVPLLFACVVPIVSLLASVYAAEEESLRRHLILLVLRLRQLVALVVYVVLKLSICAYIIHLYLLFLYYTTLFVYIYNRILLFPF